MASILRLLCEIAFVTELLRQNGPALTSHVEDNLLQWEYEDFVLERYKQRLLGSVKRNRTRADGQLDVKYSTLKDVIIEVKDSYGHRKYQILLKGLKDSCSGSTVFCHQFRFAHLSQILAGQVDFNIVAHLELDADAWKDQADPQVLINDKQLNEAYPGKRRYDLSREMEQWLKNGTEKILVQISCQNRCSGAVEPILQIKAMGRQKRIRERRRARKDQDCSNRQCCLKTRYFQFKSSNFAHILAPDGFMMNFCDGICDQSLVSGSSDRDMLVQAMKISHLKFNPFKHKWVCCVPIRYASVNAIELYAEGVQRSVLLKDVKVEECGCVI